MLCSIFVYACLGYVALLFGCHLYDCWQHPPVKAAPIVAEFDLMEILDPAELLAEPPALLLPPAAESHPFELSLDKMPTIETIAAVHQPAAMPEPPADTLDVETLMDSIDIPAPSEYGMLTIRELKALAKERQIAGYSRMAKADLIAALA